MSQLLLAGNVMHTLSVDLPIALVLVGPLLLVAAMWRKNSLPELAVPAVISTVLGAASLYAFFASETTMKVLHDGQAGTEVLQRQHDLIFLAVNTLASATLLFASGLLVCRMMSQTFNKTASRVLLGISALVYILGCMWLIVAAHDGAKLADHLARHAPP
jgi:hypothetical protein